MTKKSFLSIISLLALAVICAYVSIANAFPAPQGIPVPQDLIKELPSVLMNNLNNSQKLPSFEELKNIYIERDYGQRLLTSEMDMIEMYVKQNPKDPNAWILFGKAKWAVTGRPDTPEQCFLKASQLGSEEGTILFHYAIIKDINRSNMKSFDELYSFAQKGNLLAAFIVAETLTHGRDYFPVVFDLPDEQRLGAAAAFYEMVINANFIDWGKNCSDIAKIRLQEMGITFDVAAQPNAQNDSTTTSMSSGSSSTGGKAASNDTIRGFDVKYLTEKQKKDADEAFDFLEDDAIKLDDMVAVGGEPLWRLPENVSKTSPALYKHYEDRYKKLQYVVDTLRQCLSDIYAGKVKDAAYYTNLYNKLAKEKVFDWVEDTNKRKTAYDKVKGCCEYYGKVADAYHSFASIPNSRLKELISEQRAYDGGRTIGEAIDFALEKPNWQFKEILVECAPKSQGTIIMSKTIVVDGYYESALNTMVHGMLFFRVVQTNGEQSIKVEYALGKEDEWFDYALR